jgi:hypothetical protein
MGKGAALVRPEENGDASRRRAQNSFMSTLSAANLGRLERSLQSSEGTQNLPLSGLSCGSSMSYIVKEIEHDTRTNRSRIDGGTGRLATGGPRQANTASAVVGRDHRRGQPEAAAGCDVCALRSAGATRLPGAARRPGQSADGSGTDGVLAHG